MPSPFPGMDPFIESQLWPDFHASFIPFVRELLVPSLPPSYVCQLERHVYVMIDEKEIEQPLAPDGNVAAVDSTSSVSGDDQIGSIVPEVLTLPDLLPLKQPYLMIRDDEERSLVTVIELLSPWNKSTRGGQSQYLTKRREFFHSSANVVEIDLLRDGKRLPYRESLPEGDYFCSVSRPERRPSVAVYSWPIHHRLPIIPIPLRFGDDDVPLDLQDAFHQLYDRAAYRKAIKYDRPVSPETTETEQAWIADRIATWSLEMKG